MATNRDLLKEAIADAKAVKETAIANAKAALEEAFTPQLKSMFAAKLQEMELDEEENEREGFGDFDTKDNAGFGKMDAKALDEEDLDEYAELQPTDLPKGMSGVEKDEDMMEVDLEELLRELEEEEETMEGLYEAEEEEEDMEMSDEESEEEGEPLDLEDMTDEDLKSMIEDVIKDMISSGELEAGHEGMEDEEGMEVKDEEEVDLAELLKEIEEMEDKMYEEKEPMNEGFMELISGNDGLASFEVGATILSSLVGIAAGLVANAYRKYKKDEKLANMKDAEVAKLAAKDASFQKSPEVKAELNKDAAELKQDASQLSEAYKTIKALKSELNEINLLNAKLLYTNKIFKAKNLNESQKVKVLSSFDKATTVGEVKLVFETLNEGIKVKPNVIKENLGRASKTTVTPSVKKPIVESNDAFLRMQKLAGII